MSEQKPLKVVGFDPSLSNWGIAAGMYWPEQKDLLISDLRLAQPTSSTSKQVRQNSKDLSSATQLAEAVSAAVSDFQPHAIFVEVPHGSQSARSMASYGICVGILGALRAAGYPFFELTATEVKLATVGTKTATKNQMIGWAMEKHPYAEWPTYVSNGKQRVTASKAEHMADAVAAIHTGLQLPAFQQLLAIAA